MPVTLQDVIRNNPHLPSARTRLVKPGLMAVWYDGKDTGYTVRKTTWASNDSKAPAWYAPTLPWQLHDPEGKRKGSWNTAKQAAASLTYHLRSLHCLRLFKEAQRDEESAHQAAVELADLRARVDSPALDQAATDLGTDPATLLNTLRRHGLTPKEN